MFRQIAEDFGFELVELEVVKEHVDVLLNCPPRHSIAKMVRILNSISASQMFEEYLELRQHLWKREFWEDGCFVRTVGNAVTVAVVQRYIRYHRHEEHETVQLKLC